MLADGSRDFRLHDSQIIQLVHNGLIDHIVDKYAHGVKTGGQGYGILVEPGFKILDLQVCAFRIMPEAGQIIGFGVEKCYFHTASLLLIGSIMFYRRTWAIFSCGLFKMMV